MREVRAPLGKQLFLWAVFLVYLGFGVIVYILLAAGVLHPSLALDEDNRLTSLSLTQVPYQLELAKDFLNNRLIEKNGHVNLAFSSDSADESSNTNSEAVSYYVLWNVMSHNRQTVDKELVYIKDYLLHPVAGYMVWRLNAEDMPIGDGSNIASDADLRTIKALYFADKQWPDGNYLQMADALTTALEHIAITSDSLFAPYGGVTGGVVWKANEVWLSYGDFEAFALLAERKGQPWTKVYQSMKNAVLNAQLPNGLYNTQLDEQRIYHNTLDGGNYSINVLWVMVRAAESSDAELQASASHALAFYKTKFENDGKLYTSYTISGDSASDAESPWVYALVGRAALALDDRVFAEQMIAKLLEFQDVDENSLYFGAFVEGSADNPTATQFTMQESILTLQTYVEQSALAEGN